MPWTLKNNPIRNTRPPHAFLIQRHPLRLCLLPGLGTPWFARSARLDGLLALADGGGAGDGVSA